MVNASPKPPRPPALGDILAGDAKTARAGQGAAEAPVDARPDFERTIRAYAVALSEDPDELLRLAKGATPLARLARFLLGEQQPAARVSSGQALYHLHDKLHRAGLDGQALWDEVVRQHGRNITADSAKKGVQRYREHLRKLSLPETIADVFSPDFSTDKTLKPRGPKPRNYRRT
jgi:hypothetical protein